MPREIRPKVEVALGGSFFAKVVRDDVVGNRLDYRMTEYIWLGDAYVQNANPRYLSEGLAGPPLALFVPDRRYAAQGLLPEGGEGLALGSGDTVQVLNFEEDLQDMATIETVFQVNSIPNQNGPIWRINGSGGSAHRAWALWIHNNPLGFLYVEMDTTSAGPAPVLSGYLADPFAVNHVVVTRPTHNDPPGTPSTLAINGVVVDSQVVAASGELTTTIFIKPSLWGITYGAFEIYYRTRLSAAQIADHYKSLVWTDISEDVRDQVPLVIEHGNRSDDPLQRLAPAGMATFALDNSVGNSAHTRGYYTPGGPVSASGFNKGTPVRISSLNSDEFGATQQFHGRITNIAPTPGIWDEQLVHVMCADFFDAASKSRLNELTILENVRADEVIQLVMASSQIQPPYAQIDFGSDVYAYALDNSQDERMTMYQEFGRLVMSELGYIYTNRLGMVFENRTRRLLYTPLVAVISGHFLEADISESSDAALNQIEVTIHPRTVDASPDTVLFNITNPIEIGSGDTKQLVGPYRVDSAPDTVIRVGGKDMVAPASGTDYEFNTQADGLGDDITSFLTVVAGYGANGVSYRLTNTYPLTGYVIKLQARGRGVYDYRSQVYKSNDIEAINADGLNSALVDMVYQTDANIGQSAADLLKDLYVSRRLRMNTVTVAPRDPWFSALAASDMLVTDVGQAVRVSDEITGIDDQYYINGRRLEFGEGGDVRIKFWITPADLTPYWVMDVSRLDLETRLWYL